MIKAISFDVWNTLILPNPEFAIQRKKFIAQVLNVDEEYVVRAYHKTKHFVDNTAEAAGNSFSTKIVYSMLLDKLIDIDNKSNEPEQERPYQELMDGVNKLFLKHPPIIPDSNREMIKRLDTIGLKFGIASNSNFISGIVMHPFLEESFGCKFNFSVYSDLEYYAKPHERFFGMVAKRCGVRPSEIVHIGDNKVCDGGASNFGMRAVVIGSISDLSNIVEEICDDEKTILCTWVY